MIQLIKMFGFPSWSEVKIRVIASCTGGLDRIFLLLQRKLLKSLIDLFGGKKPLLNPSFFATGSTNFCEAPLSV